MNTGISLPKLLMNKQDILQQIDNIYDDFLILQNKIEDLTFRLTVMDNQICELRADIEDIDDGED